MRPIMLHGHERSITQIRYNREGDLLFSSAKDSEPNVWYSLNGERLGSFKGHTGAVWSIDVTWDTRLVLTAAADNSCKLWDCETGKSLNSIATQTAVRSCNFSYSGNMLLYTTDKSMGYPCEIFMYDIRDGGQMTSNEPAMRMPLAATDSKITCSLWGALDEFIVTGHEDGSLSQWDVKAADRVHVKKDAHKKQILDIQASKDLGMIITASKDTTAKLFDAATLNHLKTYKTDRPVNSAAISPTRDHVLVGGGQEAMDVTTTAGKTGKFDAKIYHLVFEEEFARVKGHFGPINSVAFHPNGDGYSSGGEDGYVRVHQFDPSYFQFEFEF